MLLCSRSYLCGSETHLAACVSAAGLLWVGVEMGEGRPCFRCLYFWCGMTVMKSSAESAEQEEGDEGWCLYLHRLELHLPQRRSQSLRQGLLFFFHLELGYTGCISMSTWWNERQISHLYSTWICTVCSIGLVYSHCILYLYTSPDNFLIIIKEDALCSFLL